jgi:hypothetical protein
MPVNMLVESLIHLSPSPMRKSVPTSSQTLQARMAAGSRSGHGSPVFVTMQPQGLSSLSHTTAWMAEQISGLKTSAPLATSEQVLNPMSRYSTLMLAYMFPMELLRKRREKSFMLVNEINDGKTERNESKERTIQVANMASI